MSLLYQKHASRPLTLDNRVEPELYRDVFPYTHVSRIEFDDTFLVGQEKSIAKLACWDS